MVGHRTGYVTAKSSAHIRRNTLLDGKYHETNCNSFKLDIFVFVWFLIFFRSLVRSFVPFQPSYTIPCMDFKYKCSLIMCSTRSQKCHTHSHIVTSVQCRCNLCHFDGVVSLFHKLLSYIIIINSKRCKVNVVLLHSICCIRGNDGQWQWPWEIAMIDAYNCR